MPGETALRESENNALSSGEQSFYRGSGRPSDDKNNGKKKGGWLLAKKKGFAGLILSLALMTGGGAFLGSTNSLLAPALNEVVTEVTDTQYASGVQRFIKLTSYQMDNSALDTTITGKLKYSSMSNSFKKRLESNGIEVNGSGSKRTLTFDGEEISASDFSRVYNDNVEFRDAYTGAKRGRIMGFFDNIANKIYSKLGIDRNIFKNYKQDSDAEVNKKNFDDTMTEKMEGDTDTSIKTNHGEEETYEETDPETGETEQKKSLVNKENDSGTATNTESTTQAKGYLENVSKSVQQATSMACTAMNVINAISISIAANEIYQSINYFMGLAENPSKMKMGYGSESGINSLLNFLTTSSTTEVEDYENMQEFNGSISDNDDIKVGTTTVTGSPMESQGMIKIMTGMAISTSGLGNFSLERVSNKLSTKVGAFKTCNMAKAGTSVVSIAVSLIPGVGQVKIVGSFLTSIFKSAIITISMSTLLSFLIPTIAQVFFTNVFENATGIPAGELYAKGASAANTRIGRSGSSQSLGNEEMIAAYNKVNDTVIAQDAEVDRYKRSPFDITSKNTFLGSIAYNFGTTTSTGFTGKIKNLLRNTSSSIHTIMGNVYADGETSYMTTFGDCPTLESIGAKGDIYCNPITVTDTSTIKLEPDDETYLKALQDGGLDCSGETCTIDKKSEIAKYINYCDNRDSPFGAVDSNILGSLKSLGDGGDLAIGLAGSIPIVGDIMDLIEAGVDEANLPWATGQNCVANNSTDWNTKYKYYQRFIEDQRILEQMGNYEDSKSPVTAYLEKYEAENPLDNSPSGYLARISGLSKDDAQLVLDVAWYYNYLNEYDATTRIAMDGTASDTLNGEEVIAKLDYEFRYKGFEKNFESDNHASEAIVAEHIIYADIRNRSYAA